MALRISSALAFLAIFASLPHVQANEEQHPLTPVVRLELECAGCDECDWDGSDKNGRATLGGGGHSLDDCKLACLEMPSCNYAAHSSAGYCHLFETCTPVGSWGGSKTNKQRWKKHVQAESQAVVSTPANCGTLASKPGWYFNSIDHIEAFQACLHPVCKDLNDTDASVMLGRAHVVANVCNELAAVFSTRPTSNRPAQPGCMADLSSLWPHLPAGFFVYTICGETCHQECVANAAVTTTTTMVTTYAKAMLEGEAMPEGEAMLEGEGRARRLRVGNQLKNAVETETSETYTVAASAAGKSTSTLTYV